MAAIPLAMTLDRLLENISFTPIAWAVNRVMPGHAGAAVEENRKDAARLFSAY
jgi:hypothetical protein